MTRLDLPNPFVKSIVADAWERLEFDAPALHAEAFDLCRAALEQVAAGRGSRSVLLRGQPGSGKTHVLARLRRATAAPLPDPNAPPPNWRPPHAAFSFVRLQTHARSIARHVRRTLVEDLLRRVDDGPTQLEWMFLLQAKGELLKPEKHRLWWQSLRWPDRREIAEEQVDELLNRFDRRFQLGRNLCAALKHLALDRNRRDACDWLRDGELPDAARDALGMAPVPRDADPEEESLALIRALARLAAPHLPIVLCFDQIEALQTHAGDQEGLFAFGRLVSSLHDQTENLLLVSCVQSTFNDMLRRAVREADMDRLAEEAALLRRPTWEEAEELIARRLDAQEEVAQARTQHTGRLWPLPAAPLRDLVENEGYTPRRLIAWCKAEFERLRTGQAAPPPPLEEFLRQEFERTLAEVAAAWSRQDTEETLLHGLPLAWSAAGWGEAGADARDEVDLRLEGEARLTAVSICHASGNKLTHRLERLRRKVEQGELENLVLVRAADLPFSATATKAQEHWHALQQAGAAVARSSTEALQQLEAVRRLLSAALAGELANDGETVAPRDVQAWLAAHLPGALRELLEETANQRESWIADTIAPNQESGVRGQESVMAPLTPDS